MNYDAIVAKTLRSVDSAIKAIQAETTKAITTATGLVGYNLQAPASQLVPLMSPFRGRVPRRVKPGSNADNWKNITAVTVTSKPSVSEAEAAPTVTTTVAAIAGTFKAFGVGDSVTREAVASSQGFDDALAKATRNALLAGMKLEEIYFLGGSLSQLTAPQNPAIAAASGKGSLTNSQAYYAKVVALDLPAMQRIALDRPADADSGGDCLLAGNGTNRTTAALCNPAAAGWGVLSSEVNFTASTGDAARISWDPVNGAAGYAVFMGTATGDANLKINAIVTQCRVTITSHATGGAAANAGSLCANAADTEAYDGMIPQIVTANGSVVKNLAGKLAGANGEITIIGDLCSDIFDNAKIGQLAFLCAGQEARRITALGATQNTLNIVAAPEPGGRTSIGVGAHAGSIVNPITGDVCPVEALPWLPGGMILAVPLEFPYADMNVSAAFEWVGAFDWERWDYGSTTSTGPVYAFEVRNFGVLEGRFLGGCGMIRNIWKG
jgi:hypothetical protein